MHKTIPNQPLKNKLGVPLCTSLAAAVLFLIQTTSQAQTNYQRLKSFGFPELSSGSAPQSQLIKGTDGALYGTTYQAGLKNYGTVFRVNTDGTEFKLLHSFSGG